MRALKLAIYIFYFDNRLGWSPMKGFRHYTWYRIFLKTSCYDWLLQLTKDKKSQKKEILTNEQHFFFPDDSWFSGAVYKPNLNLCNWLSLGHIRSCSVLYSLCPFASVAFLSRKLVFQKGLVMYFLGVWSCFWHVTLCYMMHILLLYWILNLNKCTRYDTTQICFISWSSRVSYHGKREHLWWKLMSCFYCFGDGFHCSVLLWEASEIALRWKLINKIIPCLRSHRPCIYLSDFRYVLILVSQRLASWSISFYDIGLVAPLVLLSFFLCTNHYH